MPEPALDADAALRLTVAELDACLRAARPDDADPHLTLDAAHRAGQARGAEQMHRLITDVADISE